MNTRNYTPKYPILNVLIPSIGRSSLSEITSDINNDSCNSGLRVQIYLALNGSMTVKAPQNSVKVLNISDKPIGVAETVNRALKMIPNGVTWTIADDERWLNGKFLSDLDEISKLGTNFILLPKSIFEDELGKSVRPRIPIRSNESVYNYLFGKPSIGRNKRYISLSGACAYTPVWRSVKFPEGLSTREDIEYLRLQQMLGCTLVQSAYTTVKINVSLSRSAKREIDPLDALTWAVGNLSKKEFIGFIGGSWSKPLVYTSNSRALFNMISLIAKDSSMDIGFLVKVATNCLLIFWLIIIHILKFSLKYRRKRFSN